MITIVVSTEEEKERVNEVFSQIDRYMHKSWNDCGLNDYTKSWYEELSSAQVIVADLVVDDDVKKA